MIGRLGQHHRKRDTGSGLQCQTHGLQRHPFPVLRMIDHMRATHHIDSARTTIVSEPTLCGEQVPRTNMNSCRSDVARLLTFWKPRPNRCSRY